MGHSPRGAGTTSRPPGYVLSPKIGTWTLFRQYREQSQHTQPAAGHTALAPRLAENTWLLLSVCTSLLLTPPSWARSHFLPRYNRHMEGTRGRPTGSTVAVAGEAASTVTLTPARSEVASRWSRWLTEKVSPRSPGARKWLHKCAAGSRLWGKHGCSGKSGHTGLLALPQAQFPNL